MVKTKLALKQIKIERIEGTHEETEGGPVIVHSFPAVDKIISGWAETAPDNGGYDKCDFWVTWENDETYKGRFDMERKHRFPNNEIGNQIKGFLNRVKSSEKLLEVYELTVEEVEQYLEERELE